MLVNYTVNEMKKILKNNEFHSHLPEFKEKALWKRVFIRKKQGSIL